MFFLLFLAIEMKKIPYYNLNNSCNKIAPAKLEQFNLTITDWCAFDTWVASMPATICGLKGGLPNHVFTVK